MKHLPTLAVACWLAHSESADAQAPVAELSELVPGDGGFHQFGSSVSISADRALVGAYLGDGLTGTSQAGSAYVYERQVDGTWSQVAELAAGDGGYTEFFSDLFGYSVSVSGDLAVIGTRWDDDVGTDSGSAYVYERQPSGTWTQMAKFTASDGSSGDEFGFAVSVSGARALIGAPSDDDVASASGAAYVFERKESGAWSEVAKLKASDAAAFDYFGRSLSLSGDRALVGAKAPFPIGSDPPGAAYLYERQASGAWIEIAVLSASDGIVGDEFGSSVSLSGTRALIGEDEDDDLGPDSGAAYVFERQASGSWAEVAKLTASDGSRVTGFGISASINGDRASVGAFVADGIGVHNRSAYAFERQASGAWVETAQLLPSDATALGFGRSASFSGDRVLLGAYGSAYLYDVQPLSGDVEQVSLSGGGTQRLAIDAGHLHASEIYLVLGSTSGTSPGIALGAGLVLPLESDPYLLFTLGNPGSPPLTNSLGTLGSAGGNWAAFGLPSGTDPALAGVTVHHAYLTISHASLAVEFISNALPVLLAP